jgi:hypothetical protein
VYRVSPEKWQAEEARLAEPYFRTFSDRTEREALNLAYQYTRWQPWYFNEVVAWIVIEGFHDVVKADLWRRQGQRMHRHPTSFFRWIGKLTELWFNPEDADQQIAEDLRHLLLTSVRATPGMRNRYVDLQMFDRVAPFLNWKQALRVPEYR